MNTKKTLNTLLAGAVAITALGAATSAHAMKDGQEKCYGVVKTGMNGCASADKAHGCAGQATTDASGVEWVALPTGTCDKLAGGSTTPIEAEAASDAANDAANDAIGDIKDKAMDGMKDKMKK